MVRYTKQLIEDGRFGDLTHYRGRFFSMYGRDRPGVLSWRFLQEEAGYGALTDIMSHATDLALHLAGPIRRVVSVKETFVSDRPVPTSGSGTHYDRGKPGDPAGEVTNEDYVGALVEFANGARGTLEADRSIFGPQSSMAFEINGSRGLPPGITRSSTNCGSIWPRNSRTTGSSRCWPGTPSPVRATSFPGAAIRSDTRT